MSRPEFDTEQDAFDWMYEQVDDPCIDNDRVGYEDDPDSMELYKKAESNGCCGFADYEVVIDGRYAMIGCNYGH